MVLIQNDKHTYDTSPMYVQKNVLFERKNKRCHKRSYASFLMENEFVRTLSRNEN